MDARSFGTFLARTRRERGLTQSALARQLHVTDKAVSRWERGLGFPDIGTLEPLAQALGLTLEELMQAGQAPGGADEPDETKPAGPPVDIQWQSVRAALFWLSAALAVAAQFLLPGQVTTQWHIEDGVLYPRTTLPALVAFPLCFALTVLLLQVWKAAARGGFYRSALVWLQILHPRIAPWAALGWQLFWCGWAMAPVVCEMVLYLFNG